MGKTCRLHRGNLVLFNWHQQAYLIVCMASGILYPVMGLVTSFFSMFNHYEYLQCFNDNVKHSYSGLTFYMRSFSAYYFGFTTCNMKFSFTFYFSILFAPFQAKLKEYQRSLLSKTWRHPHDNLPPRGIPLKYHRVLLPYKSFNG